MKTWFVNEQGACYSIQSASEAARDLDIDQHIVPVSQKSLDVLEPFWPLDFPPGMTI